MFCPICGKDIDDGSTFCPECNNSIESADGVDGNMPSQMIYNNDDENMPDAGSGEKKKTSAIISVVLTVAVVVAVVVCIGVLSVKQISGNMNKAKPVAEISAAIRNSIFKTTAFNMNINISNAETDEKESINLTVDYGEGAEDTDFYYEDGRHQFAYLDGIGYNNGAQADVTGVWRDLDSFIYMTLGLEVNTEQIADTVIVSGISEDGFEAVFNAYGPFVFAYYMNDGEQYTLPEYYDVQVVFAQFLNGRASQEAFSIEEADGKYNFTVNTENFLNEFVAFARESKELSDHFEYWVSAENEKNLKNGIVYCAEQMPEITGSVSIDANGYITKVHVDVGSSYKVDIEFTDINTAVVEKAKCEAITAHSQSDESSGENTQPETQTEE